MIDEIEQIRARSADHMANVPNTHDRAQLDIATLLAHIDAQDRTIAALERGDEQAALENGRTVVLNQLRAVLTPEAIDELICSSSDARAARDARIALRKARRLLHD